ncbi:MAG: hypothetical protein ACR2PK_08820, partial [Acidimicrobiales bacterium]
MNVEIEIRDGLITRWFNLFPGGPGYDDRRDLHRFLWTSAGESLDRDLQACLDIQLNDPGCVETVAPYLDEFRAMRAAES